MIGQNILLELVEGDKVQVYVNTASGLFDHKNSHYTQFIGAMLRWKAGLLNEHFCKDKSKSLTSELVLLLEARVWEKVIRDCHEQQIKH